MDYTHGTRLQKNICNQNNIKLEVENINFKKEKYIDFLYMLKKFQKKNLGNCFLKKLHSLTENNKSFLFSKIQKKYKV